MPPKSFLLSTLGIVFLLLAVPASCGDAGNDTGGALPAGVESCGTGNNLFSVEPLEPSDYTEISPLGATNPSSHTFPTVHTYMMLADNATPSPIYAPGKITIYRIRVSENITQNSTDYSVDFYVCSEVSGYFLHVTTLSDSLLSQAGTFSGCNTETHGTDTFRSCGAEVSITLSAGTLIGYAGGPNSTSAALDFGLRDTRTGAQTYMNPDRLVNSNQLYVVCPYDYFEAGQVYDNLQAKLRAVRTADPVCGMVAYDVADSAQGLWYLKGTTDTQEDNDIALVPSNEDPSVGVLSIGNSSVGTNAYYFDFTSSGTVNRNFIDITSDGQIYCFDELRNYPDALSTGHSQSLDGYLFLKMTTNTELMIERIPTGGTSCPSDTSTLSFSNSAVSFERQ